MFPDGSRRFPPFLTPDLLPGLKNKENNQEEEYLPTLGQQINDNTDYNGKSTQKPPYKYFNQHQPSSSWRGMQAQQPILNNNNQLQDYLAHTPQEKSNLCKKDCCNICLCVTCCCSMFACILYLTFSFH